MRTGAWARTRKDASGAARAAPMTHRPAGVVPVLAILRLAFGDDDEVPEARRDVLVAPWAHVGLARLVGLDASHRDRPRAGGAVEIFA